MAASLTWNTALVASLQRRETQYWGLWAESLSRLKRGTLTGMSLTALAGLTRMLQGIVAGPAPDADRGGTLLVWQGEALVWNIPALLAGYSDRILAADICRAAGLSQNALRAGLPSAAPTLTTLARLSYAFGGVALSPPWGDPGRALLLWEPMNPLVPPPVRLATWIQRYGTKLSPPETGEI